MLPLNPYLLLLTSLQFCDHVRVFLHNCQSRFFEQIFTRFSSPGSTATKKDRTVSGPAGGFLAFPGSSRKTPLRLTPPVQLSAPVRLVSIGGITRQTGGKNSWPPLSIQGSRQTWPPWQRPGRNLAEIPPGVSGPSSPDQIGPPPPWHNP